jgi:predicted AlkP superfamily pyrophosphatase or phosphodiesterase
VPVSKKLLVVDVAALGWNIGSAFDGFARAASVFPALTSVAQATFRTGALPTSHGLVGNGFLFRDLRKVLFWEQAASLVEGARIWDAFRARGRTVGMMFWQQSMGEAVDLVVTPAPIHKHSGGMIQACYTQPATLEQQLIEAIGRPFNLMNYWGPLANRKSTDWIVDAVCAVMAMPKIAPDLLLTYLPHLDYDLQRYGPHGRPAETASDTLRGYIERIQAACAEHGYEWIFFGDYAIEPVTHGAVFPNHALRDAGLFHVRDIRSMAYSDFFTSPAFAVVDHQIAHVYCRDASSAKAAADVLRALPGVREVLDRTAQATRGIAHPLSGELVAVAEAVAWFAYPWFDRKSAPDYASHVDIHNKPGYDPCELFFGWPPLSVSFNTAKIRGSHGNIGAGYETAWSTSLAARPESPTMAELAQFTRAWLDADA